MELKKTKQGNIAFILDQEESNLIKEIVASSQGDFEVMKEVVRRDDLTGLFEKIPFAKKAVIRKINKLVDQVESEEVVK